jgi:hypothetical protein
MLASRFEINSYLHFLLKYFGEKDFEIIGSLLSLNHFANQKQTRKLKTNRHFNSLETSPSFILSHFNNHVRFELTLSFVYKLICL